MKNIYQIIVCLFSSIRLVPHWIILNIHKNRSIIHYEINRWLKIKDVKLNSQLGFIYLMTFNPEFRNLFYYRISHISKLINFLCPKLSSLYVQTPKIGPGLYIQHGFSTIINAKSIGKDCWINQQVTIGYSNATDCPIILDGVTVNAGAVVVGNVKIGNNSKVGANAVVVKSVPENCTVVGVPAYIVKRNGVRVREELKSSTETFNSNEALNAL